MSDDRGSEPLPHRGGPWPAVVTRGELEPGLREWLHTNGTGAYAMSTVPLMHTRRHHGMLVATLEPPLDRHVILSHAETKVETATGKVLTVSTHQYPGMAPTPGYRALHAFHQDPLPRWIFRLGKLTLERKLCLVPGHNTVVLSYTWYGRWPARLTIKPLMALRPVRQVAREHGAMIQRVSLRRGTVEVQPVAHLPAVQFRHAGTFIGSPAWFRRFEYSDDPQRAEPSIEDLWSPGLFEFQLQPGIPAYLLCGLGALPDAAPAELVEDAERHWLAQDPGEERPASVRALSVAAEQFVATRGPRPALITGFPFYEVRTRDTCIALSGALLVRGRRDDARLVLGGLLRELHAGLLPDRLPEQRGEVVARSADATLWAFVAAHELTRELGVEDPFVRDELFPALRRAFVRIRSGTIPGVVLTPEGLLANGHPDAAMTWMAARAHGRLVTPRRGLAVELQALWTRACAVVAELGVALGDPGLTELGEGARAAAVAAFRQRFWCEESGYPYDVLAGPEALGASRDDAAVRPNALIALALDPELFEHWQARAIVDRVRQSLLTPLGVRSLAPGHPDYLGVHVGPPEERESSYHQGTAWTYLLGAYARAALRLDPDDFDLREELRLLVERAVDSGPVFGMVAQLADGDEPHRARGCPAQAWSVSELLRTLVVELGL